MKKMNNKGFSLVELIVVVAIMAVLMAVLVPTLIRNVEKTRVQKDKSAIAEIHHATELAIADEEFMNAEPSANGATVSGGKITIANLFKADDDDSQALATEVAATVGDTVKLTSKMKNDCTITIELLDYTTGKVVFQVVSSNEGDAKGTGESFYIDSTGENKGVYGEDENDDDNDGDNGDGDN